jgi:uncharacterized repeat protein (TIGR01451 family)
MYAQTPAPGGTGLNVKLWLAADKLNGTDMLQNNFTDVNPWKDLSGNGMDFVQNGTNLIPRLNYGGMNFHPAVEFLFGTNSAEDKSRKLVSSLNFTTSKDEAYYTFWVSGSDYISPLVYMDANVFVFGNENENGWALSASNHAVYHTDQSDYVYRRIHSNLNKRYGIGAVFRPNSITYNAEIQYHNGHEQAFTAREIGNHSSKAVIGNSNLNDNNYFYGQVQEIIVLSAAKGGGLNTGELKKVHSYLAIKYGQTMNAAAFPDFVNSAGSNVWTGANNTGYTSHIFGIGRDDAAGLYQKQSANQEFQNLIVFAGDSIAAINSQNNGSLDNMTYLMFGSNGAAGKTPYGYAAGTSFVNGTLNHSITERLSRVYKTQLTGAGVIQVNMRMRAQYVLVSSNANFPVSSTRIYPMEVEDDIARNVEIRPGDYVGFACQSVIGPGGITSGLRMWLRADHASALNVAGKNVSEWRDINRDDFKYEYLALYPSAEGQYRNKMPRYEANHPKMNFHPSIHFPDKGTYLSSTSGLMSVAAPDSFSVISLTNVTQFGDYDAESNGRVTYFMGFGRTDPTTVLTGAIEARKPAFGIADLGINSTGSGGGRFVHYSTSFNSVNGSEKLFNTGATTLTLHQVSRYGKTNNFNVQFEIGANIESFNNQTNLNLYSEMVLNGASMLGTGSRSERNMIGYMSEMIAYERILTDGEKNKIYSYLGMKYGVTLDPEPDNATINYNYVLSDNTPVWPGTSSPLHRQFHHNVAMVVKDEAADLLNRQARSTDVGDFIVVGVNGTSLSIDGSNNVTGLTADLSAIAWGNNGEPYDGTDATRVNISNLSYVCGNMDYRAKRIWMIDKTGIGDQKILLGAGGESFYENDAKYQVFFLFSNHLDSLSTTNNRWSQAVPAHYYNGLHQASYTLTDEITYFTIGVKVLPGSCETCQFQGYKTLYFTPDNWPGGTTDRTFDLGDGFSTRITTGTGSGSSFYSDYPQAVANTLSEYRRGNLEEPAITTVYLSSPAAASFQLYGIDRKGNVLDEVDIVGYCGNDPVYPVLNYVAAAEASSYTIVNAHRVSATHLPLPGYTDSKGRLNVLFDRPVERIEITHLASGADKNDGSQGIGVGPVQFFCVPPLPVPNEDGLIFMKSAAPSSGVSLCEPVSYTFQLYNTSCSAVDMTVSDVLPAGMRWVEESFQVQETLATNFQINSYGGQDALMINGLTLPPASFMQFTAAAFFDGSASAATSYSNRGLIEYKNPGGANRSLVSCDRYSANGCATTTVTTSPVTVRVIPVVAGHSADKSAYKPGDRIRVRLKIHNDDSAAISDVGLNVIYNEAFTCLLPSVQWSGSLTGGMVLKVEAGNLRLADMTLPQDEESWVEFELEAPAKSGLEKVFDESGSMLDVEGNVVSSPEQQAVFPLLIDYGFSASAGDRCIEIAFLNANGRIEIPYNNKAKAYIIGNKQVSGKGRR